VTYIFPIVGITLGVLVLSERLHPAEILGTVLIIGGLLLANSKYGQRRLFGRATAPAP
jgi:drug/metabolite transporter (DMT)-like permease